MLDSHCHIDQYSDPLYVVQHSEEKRIVTIAVTNLPSDFVEGSPFVSKSKYVRLALGLHPLRVREHTMEELIVFSNNVGKTSYIGEIGLDSSKIGSESIKQQIKSFRYVLELIKDRPRFITLHSRGAEALVLDLLKEHKVNPCVFHWFSGNHELVSEIEKYGHYFSVNPAMLRSDSGRNIVKSISRERLILESDGPYVKIDSRTVMPSDCGITINYLSKLWGEDVRKVDRQIMDNFFRIIKPISEAKKIQ